MKKQAKQNKGENTMKKETTTKGKAPTLTQRMNTLESVVATLTTSVGTLTKICEKLANATTQTKETKKAESKKPIVKEETKKENTKKKDSKKKIEMSAKEKQLYTHKVTCADKIGLDMENLCKIFSYIFYTLKNDKKKIQSYFDWSKSHKKAQTSKAIVYFVNHRIDKLMPERKEDFFLSF